jgi:hypothetical protein
MQDIRFLGVEGENLLLETESGEQFRLRLDDGLRKLIRKEPATSDNQEQISPRDIQIEIRSGVTVQELADRTGASVDYIEKFAATVLDELQHVISSALAVRILVPGDRFNEPVHAEFGEVISERLTKNRASNVAWSSRKDETGTWIVTCHFKTNAGQHNATWSFDLRKLVLTPENDTAMQLQNQTPLQPTAKATPPQKSKTADEPLVATGSIVQAVEVREPETSKFMVVPEPIEPEPTKVEIGNLATTTDLTDILKKRAAEAAATSGITVVPEPAPVTTPIKVAPEAVENPSLDLEATQPIESAPKKGRVPVQSWEEILLSTRSEDDQAN